MAIFNTQLKLLVDKWGNFIVCSICRRFITRADGYGQSGFNFQIKYYCWKCLLKMENARLYRFER